MKQNYTALTLDSISDIEAEDWDACAGDDPFVCHAHLHALESSDCVSPATGFKPNHLVLRDNKGEVVAAAPAYVKEHSHAELGADMGWSLAYERAGGPYYPKLQVEVPFCPFPGSRLLVRAGCSEEKLRERLVRELIAISDQLNLSSLHITYMRAEEQQLAAKMGLVPGQGTQFIWRNNGYQDLDDYFANLKRKPRQMVSSERRRLGTTGLTWERLTGNELSSDVADRMLGFYQSTHQRNGEKAFVNKEYFVKLAEKMPENVLLVLGKREGEYICGTFYFRSRRGLYAQHWGYSSYVKFAHYESAYYQAIDIALADGLDFIDAGAKGQHKVARGFLPQVVHHAHWFPDPKFLELIARGLERKAEVLNDERLKLLQRYPFVR